MLKQTPEFPPASGIDYRFSPPWWQTSVCFPDDPDKPLVGREGQYYFDFGRGEKTRRSFEIMVAPELAEETRWVDQQLYSGRVPLVKTTLESGGVQVVLESFQSALPHDHAKATLPLERVGGEKRVAGFDPLPIPRVIMDWAEPDGRWDHAFRSVALGHAGDPLHYQLRVAPRGKRTVCLGFCERKEAEPGRRVMDLSVEGSAGRRALDVAALVGGDVPMLEVFEAADENGDGIIDIRVSAAATSVDRDVFLSAVWVFEEVVPPVEQILSGEAQEVACAFVNCGVAPLPPRRHFILMDLTNTTSVEQVRTPIFRIGTLPGDQPVKFGERHVKIGHQTRLSGEGRLVLREQVGPQEMLVGHEPVTLQPGESRLLVFTLDRHGYRLEHPVSPEDAISIRAGAIDYWESSALPYGKIEVPDPGIQAQIDSAIRNIFQARDIRGGLPAFHVGPTYYRQLWIIDGAFLLETATLLGRADEARAGINYMLGFQKEDGSFQLRARHWKEAGIVLWAVIRHARLTGDKDYLRQQWPQLCRALGFLRRLRGTEAAADPSAPNFRLFPWGVIDGGITNNEPEKQKPEYSNVHWALIGVRAMIAAARWLGNDEQVREWQVEYDDFMETFRRAAARDLRKDSSGNSYLPIVMQDALHEVPQRAQWTFCHAVYPGGIFTEKDRDYVAGNLAMLRATKVEGSVFGTGWIPDGIWTYFASFYAHALLCEGERDEAIEVLYSFANHAAPNLTWREEQTPVGKGTEEVGDMPHNWASAEFIRLVVHLIAMDVDGELHLCKGLPKGWLIPGRAIRLKSIATPFGLLDFSLEVAQNGQKARLQVAAMKGDSCERVILFMDGWSRGSGGKVFAAVEGIDWEVEI
jgi:hypothetical protein